MRTPLAWTLNVTISPWYSLPDFLNEPMLAMGRLLAVSSPATIAASRAICRPEAIDAAPACGPEQSGGWRRDDFLASRGMGEAQGKKVEPPPLRLRRSRRSRPLARSA